MSRNLEIRLRRLEAQLMPNGVAEDPVGDAVRDRCRLLFGEGWTPAPAGAPSSDGGSDLLRQVRERLGLPDRGASA